MDDCYKLITVGVPELDSRIFYVLLSMVDGLGPRRLSVLVDFFGSAEQVWYAGENELKSVPGIPGKVISELVDRRKRLDPEKEIQKLADSGISVIFGDDAAYPEILKQIYDPPKVLYLKGNSEVLQEPMLAVVGARKATHYGLRVAETIARELAEAGLCVVSGMARGIDTAAHKGALSVLKPTVAVLGCGVDIVYPVENKKVMADIIERGAVISEFPPGTPPVAGNFPQRNRLISGLSLGVLVVEAAEKSGSLITADFALEQGRDVFAVPGQVTNRLNRGAHRLIKQGAKLVEEARDILEELGYRIEPAGRPKSVPEENLTREEKKIYNIILDDPVSSDIIISKTGLKSSEVLSLLLVMEMKGLLKQLPGQRYVRNH